MVGRLIYLRNFTQRTAILMADSIRSGLSRFKVICSTALCREPESNEVFEYSASVSGSDPIAAALGPLSPDQLALVAKANPAVAYPQRAECKLPESLLGPAIDFGI